MPTTRRAPKKAPKRLRKQKVIRGNPTTERELVAHYYRIGKMLKRKLPPVSIEFRYTRSAFAPAVIERQPNRPQKRGQRVKHVTISINPMFRYFRILAIRELLHEMGHIIAVFPDHRGPYEHGRYFRAAMRRLVTAGAYDDLLW
jgi:hypothetical protein